MDTKDELIAEAAHLKRLRYDVDYAIDFAKQGIYSDAEEFLTFCAAHGITEHVIGGLLQALRNAEFANMNPNGLKAGAILRSIQSIRQDVDAVIERDVEAHR